VESLGYPERVRSFGMSVAATWTFQPGCLYDCGSIRLDQVSSAWKVVEVVGTWADMDGPQWPKHVVSLIKQIQRQLCFDVPTPS